MAGKLEAARLSLSQEYLRMRLTKTTKSFSEGEENKMRFEDSGREELEHIRQREQQLEHSNARLQADGSTASKGHNKLSCKDRRPQKGSEIGRKASKQ